MNLFGQISSSIRPNQFSIWPGWIPNSGRIFVTSLVWCIYIYIFFSCLASVKLNKNFGNITQYDVEEYIKKWFRYASDRNGGRMKRLKRNWWVIYYCLIVKLWFSINKTFLPSPVFLMFKFYSATWKIKLLYFYI